MLNRDFPTIFQSQCGQPDPDGSLWLCFLRRASRLLPVSDSHAASSLSTVSDRPPSASVKVSLFPVCCSLCSQRFGIFPHSNAVRILTIIIAPCLVSVMIVATPLSLYGFTVPLLPGLPNTVDLSIAPVSCPEHSRLYFYPQPSLPAPLFALL
ncbi:hypothetical protein BJX76DRAFT_157935 [Aspergillus varians]